MRRHFMADTNELEELKAKSLAIAKKRFDEVNKKSQDIIEAYITEGYKNTIANLLLYIGEERAQEVLKKLPEPVKSGIEKHIAEKKTSSQITPEAIVDAGYVFKTANWYGQEMADEYLEKLTPMEVSAFNTNYEAFLELNPILAINIDYYSFTFDDLVSLDNRAIQKVLRDAEQQDVALALKGANIEVQNKIFSNMSRRIAGMLKEDMEFMGPVRLCDIEAAQARIIQIVKRLEDDGDIVIARDNEL